jgi:hypothetical protein
MELRSRLSESQAGTGVISDVERAKPETLLQEFRKQEDIRAANDITGKSEHWASLERERRFPEAEKVRKEIADCDHEKFLAAEPSFAGSPTRLQTWSSRHWSD